MNNQTTNKPEKKVIPKPAPIKQEPVQNKTVEQLRQEIKVMDKTIKHLMNMLDTQAVVVNIPITLYRKIIARLPEESRNAGCEFMTVSDFIRNAVEIYLWANEDEKNSKKEEQRH